MKFVLNVHRLRLIHQYDHTENRINRFFFLKYLKFRFDRLTLTTRFLAFLLTSPLAFISNKLIRLLFSLLICSFFRKAKLDRRIVIGGKSIIDERRRNDERGSGCLNKSI